MKLVFATNNKHKLEEVRSMLRSEFELLSLNDIGCNEDIEETEDTLEGNAKIKSDFIKDKFGKNCFADDTGLEVEALNGAPGVYSARYAGSNPSFQDNVNKLLEEMQGVEKRKARFRTVISLTLNNEQYFFEGICEGEITKKQSGEQGFGYDPVFSPFGTDLTFAEMSLEDKSKISHRGIAVREFVAFLNGLE